MRDEKAEQFYQDIKTMEEHYQGQWDKWMMADNCWTIKRSLDNIKQIIKKEKILTIFFLCSQRFISAVSLLND